MERDILKDKEVNEFNLHGELKILPSLILYYHNQLKEAKTRAKELKIKYDYVKKQTFIRIMEAKTTEEGKKPTDNVLNAYVAVDEAVNQAFEDYMEAEREQNNAETCVKVIDSKAKCVKEAVALRKTEYYNANMTVDIEATSDLTNKKNIIKQHYERS